MANKIWALAYKDGILIKNVLSFDLGQIFDCGQCFRWEKINENEYSGIAFGKKLVVSQISNDVYFKNTSKKDFENVWKDYFDFSFDYENLKKELEKIDPVLKKAIETYPGIRILKQEPWETLCSFIISQNNNIPRIKKIISKLCENFGEKINGGYAFPSAKKLAELTEEDLAVIKSGFRAKYILDAAKKVNSKEINLEKISKMPPENAKTELMKIKGVGPKVADCVLLYGMHNLAAFPMDIWMKKVMEAFFKGKDLEVFGKYAGIAQQYLYHYTRTNPEILKK
ncbi:MAG: DNA-3-methyladenine glycosylase 2 family protein [Clostridia bacterium]|nr:DNA-3-methyladenine glycosylase 2 family protein [Clostridia bacterium]